MKNFVQLGRYFFAVAIIASGILQLIRGEFVRLVPKFPVWIPAHEFWAYATGVILIVIGSAIATGKKARPAAAFLAILFFLMLVLLAVPQAAKNPMVGFMWTNPCKTLALLGGAILLTATPPEEKNRDTTVTGETVNKFSFIAALFLGLFFFVGGIQHLSTPIS